MSRNSASCVALTRRYWGYAYMDSTDCIHIAKGTQLLDTGSCKDTRVYPAGQSQMTVDM